ncbi:MAG: hypothetical protein WA988_15520 [Candidatus Nanopelagicales bacterium]
MTTPAEETPLFPIDDLRIGRAITTGEYALPINHLAVLLACASARPRPPAGSADEAEDFVTQLIDTLWQELIYIDRTAAETAYNADSSTDLTWIVHVAHRLTNTKENNQL